MVSHTNKLKYKQILILWAVLFTGTSYSDDEKVSPYPFSEEEEINFEEYQTGRYKLIEEYTEVLKYFIPITGRSLLQQDHRFRESCQRRKSCWK